MVEQCLVVMDNCVAHKTPMIRRWLAKGPRRHLTSSSWLNQVERFFALLPEKERSDEASVAA